MNADEWFKLHTEYLQSRAWRVRRAAVLARDKERCQAGYAVCTGQAEQVHHLTYRHWRNEPLFDLIAVCTNCYEVLTNLDRGHATRDGERPSFASLEAEVMDAVTDEEIARWAADVVAVGPDAYVAPPGYKRRQRLLAKTTEVPAGGQARTGDPNP